MHKGKFIIYEMGAVPPANPYISRKRFYKCPFIFPKDSKKLKTQNVFSPPMTRPNPPFAMHPKSPLKLGPKNLKCPKHPKK